MKFIWFAVLFLVLQTVMFGQSDASNIDITKVNVDLLSDDQVKAIMSKAEASGMSADDIEQMASAKGMSQTEINKLKIRIANLSGLASGKTGNSKTQSTKRLRSYHEDEETSEETSNEDNSIFSSLGDSVQDKRVKEKEIFGFSVFNNKKLTFSPSLNIPTPQNYILGPGDELVIDVWGASQLSYQETISPDGIIVIPNVGPVNLGGLTVEEGTSKLRRELSKIYAGMKISPANTFMKVALGSSVRSIRVNVVGDVYMPGTYTLPALASVFTALYSVGGPALNGSLRDIKINRQNKTVSEIDLYDFLLNGLSPGNIMLQDQDVIFVSAYKKRVRISGQVKREAWYDLKEKETLGDLIRFCGDFTGMAYRSSVIVLRKTSKEKKVLNVSQAQFNNFTLQNGDEIKVASVLNRFENRIQLEGAVYRPGWYDTDSIGTLKLLFKKAEGLKGDAFTSRIEIFRKLDDQSTEVISVNYTDLLADDSRDITLFKDDVVYVPSIFDLREKWKVDVDGEVQRPGSYDFRENSTIEDLIVQSGGLLESASMARIEVARRIKNSFASQTSDTTALVYQFQVNKDLTLNDQAGKFLLKPFDMVFIRRSPGYHQQYLVKITGEVPFPGNYSLIRKTERVSDLIDRAGGMTSNAFPKGARLLRVINADSIQRKKALARLSRQSGDSLKVDASMERTTALAIDLEQILKNPNCDANVFLQEGDEVQIPIKIQTIKVSGAVLFPSLIHYHGKSLSGYLDMAGGVADNAKKRKICVIYPNGAIRRTKTFLFFKNYPTVIAGSEIIVPQKPDKKKMTTMETVSLASAISSLGLMVLYFLTSVK